MITTVKIISFPLLLLSLLYFGGEKALANERRKTASTSVHHGAISAWLQSSLDELGSDPVAYNEAQSSSSSSFNKKRRDRDHDHQQKSSTAASAKEWLDSYNTMAELVYNRNNEANWIYNTNITDHNLYLANEADAELSQFQQEGARNASSFDPREISDEDNDGPTIKRLLKKISTVGIKLNVSESFAFSALVGNMTGTYSTATVCSKIENKIDCDHRWSLEPDLRRILATSRDYDLLTYVWEQWRNEAGRPIMGTYKEFVDLSNRGARADGFADTGEFWRSLYGDGGDEGAIEKEAEKLWHQLLPLYEQLYAYVRKVLRDRVYGADRIRNVLPAHVLGNMWAQEWSEILNDTVPFPAKPSVDVSQAMVAQNYTPLKMFRTADKFFQSLGLIRMPDNFYANSMLEKPSDREVVCHASAWDFYNRRDVRIKMCTNVNMADLIVIHHEMGHVQYYLQYARQPLTFREGANPGFHEAIGDTVALSVSTPRHLQEIGLLPANYRRDYEEDINFLYKMALDKLAFLPFGYLIDLWRWKVFSGEYPADEWNEAWWKLRYKYQGLKSPVPRRPDDFDPGAKFHVPANTPYLRYFVAHVLQFQFYRAMCKAAGQTTGRPLHQCDFYKNQQAGRALARMLELGCSKPWPEALKAITGQRSMSAEPIIEYFQPLMDWLKRQNQGECFGWGYRWPSEVMRTLDPNRCPSDDDDDQDQIQAYLRSYNNRAAVMYEKYVRSQWTYWLNITQETRLAMDAASVAKDQFDNGEKEAVKRLNTTGVTDPMVLRQLKKISEVDLAFNDTGSGAFHGLVSRMSEIYSTAYVCNRSTPDCKMSQDPSSKWFFDPTLSEIMSKSRDYDLLTYVWKGWRDSIGGSGSGEGMSDLFRRYVHLANEGARAAGYANAALSWLSPYEDPTFGRQCADLWRQILPLYEHLHAYVRRHLATNPKFYPGRFDSSAIPAHILGNMWAQDWTGLYSDTVPYPEEPSLDVVSRAMIRQGYTPLRMFETAEDFFASLGLSRMTDEFWNNSMLEKPTSDPRRKVDCWADAEEFYNGRDYGIKMCASVGLEDLIVIHHEMGHIEYFMAYSGQPVKFHQGANPGFHEAIGDTIALSVQTPGHLRKIGLLKKSESGSTGSEDPKKQSINFLYKTALQKIAFLPFGYLIDQYRWAVFDGSVPLDQLNDGWWSARYKFQGVVPPVPRSNTRDFDPASKYHVAADVQYISYFVAHILQFQFHQALCDKASGSGSGGAAGVPLHSCDIYNSTSAGDLLKEMLALGSSVPWPVALKRMVGRESMDAAPLMTYFRDLIDWLNKTNTANGECYGWGYEWPADYDLPQPRCGKKMDFQNGSSSSPMMTNGIFCLVGFVVTVITASIY